MTDDAKTGFRALWLAFTELALVAVMIYAIVWVDGWVRAAWLATLLFLFFVRMDKWAARRELAKLHSTDAEDEDEGEDEFDESRLQEMQEKVARATMQMAEITAPIIESANGQRAKLVADGWSETAAEQMAASYFAAMIGSFHREMGNG